MLAKVYVTLKKGVHDPQGEAVYHALHSLGFRNVNDVRIGKYIELKLGEMEQDEAQRKVTEMCQKLLANTVIEGYHFNLE